MKNKLFISIILVSLVLISSGCWDYIEYEELEQVYGMGIDYNPKTHKITVTIQSTSGEKSSDSGKGSQGGEKQVQLQGVAVHSATGFTIMDAMDKLQQSVGKRLFNEYMVTIVIGKEAASCIMKDIIELLTRTTSIRLAANIFISKGTAKEIFSTIDPYSEVSSTKNIENLVKVLDETSVAYVVSVKDFEEMLLVKGIEPVAPEINVRKLKWDTQNQVNNQNNSIYQNYKNGVPIELNEGYFYIKSMAVFKGEKLKGVLSEKDSMGLTWINGKTKRLYESVISVKNANTNKHMSFRVAYSYSKIKPVITNNQLAINVKIRATAELKKYITDTKSRFLTPNVVKNMESKLSKNIGDVIRRTVYKVQKHYKSDIFGFGDMIYREHPKLWHKNYQNKWEEIFPNIPVEINVKVKIINTGGNIGT